MAERWQHQPARRLRTSRPSGGRGDSGGSETLKWLGTGAPRLAGLTSGLAGKEPRKQPRGAPSSGSMSPGVWELGFDQSGYTLVGLSPQDLQECKTLSSRDTEMSQGPWVYDEEPLSQYAVM